MTYPQCLIAQRTGEILTAQIAGCQIDVVVTACATRIVTAWDPERAQYRPKGDPYYSIECRDARANGIYHLAPNLIECKDETTRKQIDWMVEEEIEKEKESWQRRHL